MQESNLRLQSLGPRLPLILITVLALAGTLIIGAAIGQNELTQVYLVFFAIAALVAILALGSMYWVLIPIAFSFNLPAIPFGGRAFELPEIAITLCTVVFACRYALHPRSVFLFRLEHTGVMLYTAWAGLVFFLHPVGLWAMGSTSGGARFYFKIALALASFLIVANQKITERDAKWIIRLLLIGSIVSMIVSIVQYKLFARVSAYTSGSGEGFYTWHQEMALPAMWFMVWLVSRYKIREIFSFAKPQLLFLFVFCVALAAVSGKRAGFAAVLLAPLIATIVRKEYFYVLTGAILAAILVSILTFGQGELFKLPLQVQRTLSYLPGKWDWEIQSQFEGGIDPFRTEMRELAWEDIKKRPFVGQGYAVNINEIYGIYARRDPHMFAVLSLALGSSWHNTWLGIWADFGLPAVLFWAIFWTQALVIGFAVYRRTLPGSPYQTLALMLLFSFVINILRSWTSGHSAEGAFSTWWMFGVLVALKYGMMRDEAVHGPKRGEVARPDRRSTPRGIPVLSRTRVR